jgi:hypothetical protein
MREVEMNEKEGHRSGLVGPVILIGLGVVFLLNNLGILNWSVWDVIFRLWPVLLVAAGLDILIGRRSAWGALLSLVLTFALIAGALWLYGTGMLGDRASAAEQISYPLNEATHGQVVIAPAVGSLRIKASESDQLVGGTIHPARGERMHRDFQVQGETAILTLQSEGHFVGPFFGGPDWDLELSSGAALDLQIDLGVGQSEIDLTGLMIDDLNVSMGVGQTTIVLPNRGHFRAEIEGAIGSTVVVIPVGMEARIRLDTGLAARQLPDDYRQHGDAYESPGYDSAENRVELEVSQAIGDVAIRHSGGR